MTRDKKLKLIIQIPCYNEEKALQAMLSALPRSVPGVDRVEWLIIDDGSTDRTVEVAKAHGVDHVVALLPRNSSVICHAFPLGVYCHSIEHVSGA